MTSGGREERVPGRFRVFLVGRPLPFELRFVELSVALVDVVDLRFGIAGAVGVVPASGADKRISRWDLKGSLS